MEYKPGLVTASISQGNKKSSALNPFLTQLFSKKKEEVTITTTSKKTDQPNKQKIKKVKLKNGVKFDGGKSPEVNEKAGGKRKHEETMTTPTKKKVKQDIPGSGQISTAAPNDFPYIHESLLQQRSQRKTKKSQKDVNKDEKEEGTTTSSRRRKRRNKTADKRTIFVGNCPLSTDKKIIRQLFKEYGTIESMRFRCGPASKLELPRRAVIIKKEFHENARSYVCYVVFKEEEAAQKALEKNGYVLDDLHLRVDLASNHMKHDKKRSVFVGNLPFNVTEEGLRSHFLDCGDINNVRIIRDRQTSIGKGIAYIQFETKDGVTLAKKLNESEYEARKIRVMTCTNKPEAMNDKFKKKNKISRTKPDIRPETRRIVFAPSNRKSTKSFHEILQAKKDRRLKKKKKQGSQKTDGLSSIFGDMSADLKRLKTDNPKLRDKKPKDKKKSKLKDKKVKSMMKKKTSK